MDNPLLNRGGGEPTYDCDDAYFLGFTEVGRGIAPYPNFSVADGEPDDPLSDAHVCDGGI